MEKQLIKKEKPFNYQEWILYHALIIPAGYAACLIVVAVFAFGVFGGNYTDPGTVFSRTVTQIAGGITLGLLVGIMQRKNLRKVIDVTSCWIYSLAAGFAFTELVAGLVFWPLGIDRMQLRAIEGNAFPEAVIFACAGFAAGLLQWFLLRKNFRRSYLWIIASSLGWGVCIGVLFFPYLVPNPFRTAWGMVFIFALGSFLYGIITGNALKRIIRSESINS